MNFKLKKLVKALPFVCSAAVFTAGASLALATNQDGVSNLPVASVASNKLKANAAITKDRYFVLLKDEPIALYQGGIEGFSATNIKASGFQNTTSTGKLDLTSKRSMAYKEYLQSAQQQTLNLMKAQVSTGLEVDASYSVALNGFLVALTPAQAEATRKVPGVLAVHKEELRQLMTDVGPKHVGAESVWNESIEFTGSKGEGIVVGVMDSGIASYTESVFEFIGPPGFDFIPFHPSFADVGADGYDHTNPYGEGVYFGDCVDEPFWCNDKLVGVVSYPEVASEHGFSEVDMRNNTGQDPHGHGTHVASTIAGNHVKEVPIRTALYNGVNFDYYDSSLNLDISGVAPHANIISYQTCNWRGCFQGPAIASIEHAIANDVDVLNYSVGGPAASPWYSPDALAFLSAREAGIHVAVAAGNNGRSGASTVSAPGNSPWLTSVAALTHGRDFTDKSASFTGGDFSLEDMQGKGATEGISGELVYAGDVEKEEAARTAGGEGYCGPGSLPVPFFPGSVAGKVVVCKRGGYNESGNPLSRLSKGGEAQLAEAVGMILINESEDFNNVVSDLHSIPTIHLNKEQGEQLLAWMEEGEGHAVSFDASEPEQNLMLADLSAEFSSRGPDRINGDYLVPDVGAPGVDIYAAGIGSGMHGGNEDKTSRVDGDFRFMSGTSMATPHIAGMYALMAAVRPEWTPSEAQSALMTTAYTKVREDDNFDGEQTDVYAFRTGSGSARVNRAVQAGLLLNETREGFLAADPYAEQFNRIDEIPGWHGQPHMLNMPSLAKQGCLIDCSWQRTFTAAKAGTWNVSFETFDEGFSLTTDKASFSLSEGEDVVVEIFAAGSRELSKDWVNGRMVLTPEDNTLPVQTLPVTVNFIAGIVPETVSVEAQRDADSTKITGITTIGTDDLQVTKSGLAKADIYHVDLMRDPTNADLIDLESTYAAVPFNVEARTQRMVIDILETTSPDIDVFVGVDANLDGRPDYSEFDYMRYISGSSGADELIDIIDPEPGTYWIIIHNFGASDDAEDEEPTYDSVKFSVTNVNFNDDSMLLETETSVEAHEELPVRLGWDADMQKGEIYHGLFQLGISADLATNIGAVRVNLQRMDDDVAMTFAEHAMDSDIVSYNIDVAANDTAEDRLYQLKVSMVNDVSVKSLKLDGKDISFERDGQSIVWEQLQPAGGVAVAYALALDISEVQGLTDVTPTLISSVNTGSREVVTKPDSELPIKGKPIFSVSSSSPGVIEGGQFTLVGTVEDAVIKGADISYTWRQVSGPAATHQAQGKSLMVTAPEVSNSTVLQFELVGSNGERNANPVTVSVEVLDKGGSSGTFGFSLLLLGMLALRSRASDKKA